MPFCPGCGKEFSFSGCAKHLAQTTDPSCRQIYNQLYKFDSSDISLNASRDRQSGSPSSFAEDFFGTANQYHSDDFDYWNVDDKMIVDDEDGDGHEHGDEHEHEHDEGDNENEDDDEFDYLEHYFGNGWEPAIANQELANEPQ